MYYVTMSLEPTVKITATVPYEADLDNSESSLDPLEDQLSPRSEVDFNFSIHDESNEDLFEGEG